MRTVVEIATRDGVCPTSVFKPEGKGPAIIFYMDAGGPRPSLFDIAARLARHGYFVILPDLFYRAGKYEPLDPHEFFTNQAMRQAWMTKYVSTATIPNVMSDTAAFLDFLAEQHDVLQPKVGTTGYCMGGNRSLAAAGSYPDRIAAAASFHGGRLASDEPDSPHLLAPRMKARVYVAGAVEDPSFPDDMKRRLEDALTAAGVDHVIETYEGARHGWVPSDFPVHDPAAAERAWKAMLALFDSTLARRT